MSKFDFISQQLDRYEAMTFHAHPALAQQLKAVQLWQKQRMQHTHADFFAAPNHQLMANYFLNRLYGADDFDTLAFQLRRIIKNAGLVEKIIPAAALKTGEAGIELARLSMELDEQLALYLVQQQISPTDLNPHTVADAYRACDQHAARLHQLELLEVLGHRLDQYMRSRMVKAAFKMARGAAYRYQVDPIYEFIEQGFAAMEPLQSSAQFIQTFTAPEQQILNTIFAGQPVPFVV